ncbi:MAG: PqqD family protein, partial [Candidatus Aminicenantes bacterium]
RSRQTVHYVDYGQAERDCERLAAKLLDIYSRKELKKFSYTAIPRGGIIVLGMLSYVLDLQPAQLQANLESSQPLVIVDDCALSGTRFTNFLARTTGSHLVFAHLYSHPDLRQALLDKEPRLKHCAAAHDLVDHAREHYQDPAQYQAWQDHWKKLMGPGAVWLGQPDLVCFAWNEPDRPFWNPVTRRLENYWQFLPPHLCLKNRTGSALPPRPVTKRDWQIPSSVVSGAFDNALWLCQTNNLQVYSLNGVSADMWGALAAYGNLDAAVEYLLSQYDIDKATMRGDLRTFANELLSKGLLEEA